MRAAVTTLAVAFVLCWGVAKGFDYVFGPDRVVMDIDVRYPAGASPSNLRTELRERGFEVYLKETPDARWRAIGGDRHGDAPDFFSPILPLGAHRTFEDLCRAPTCKLLYAEKTEYPFGKSSKWQHVHQVAWVYDAGIIQGIASKHLPYFYPIK